MMEVVTLHFFTAAAVDISPMMQGPCDVYAAAGTPCVAAHSMVRAMYSAYAGPLYSLRRASDNATMDIGLLETGGFANGAAQVTFCTQPEPTVCTRRAVTTGNASTSGGGIGGGAAKVMTAVTTDNDASSVTCNAASNSS